MAGVLLPLVLASCWSGDDGNDTAPTSTTSGETATTTEGDSNTTTTASTTTTSSSTTAEVEYASEEEEIVARYKAYWEARFAANSPPDPSAEQTELREYATGSQLDRALDEVQANADAGLEFRRADDPVNHQRVSVVSVDGDEARVQECVVNDRVVVHSETGEIENDAVATYSVLGTMRRVDGEWRLAGTQEVQSWEGVAGCALAD